MGYYTNYRLELENAEAPDIISTLLKENEDAAWALDDEGYSKNEAKWYNAQEDIKSFSIKYPNTLFKLFGDGEESEDLWVLFAKNDKSYVEELVNRNIKFKKSKLK